MLSVLIGIIVFGAIALIIATVVNGVAGDNDYSNDNW